jgi:hypothetical protein
MFNFVFVFALAETGQELHTTPLSNPFNFIFYAVATATGSGSGSGGWPGLAGARKSIYIYNPLYV